MQQRFFFCRYHSQQPPYNTLELLMMGIVVPETCSASNKICKKKPLLHLVGILFPHMYWQVSPTISWNTSFINPLNAELNPICHLLALLAHHILDVSRIRVNILTSRIFQNLSIFRELSSQFTNGRESWPRAYLEGKRCGGGIAPLILFLGIWWWWVASFMP